MLIKVGQGLLGKLQFPDGEFPKYDRPYLVVSVKPNYIEVLNVSSTAGKERKVIFKQNKRIKNYKPPFKESSFVKLDSLTKIDKSELHKFKLLHNGECLNIDELNEIIKSILR